MVGECHKLFIILYEKLLLRFSSLVAPFSEGPLLAESINQRLGEGLELETVLMLAICLRSTTLYFFSKGKKPQKNPKLCPL